MITLYQFKPALNVPNASPFCMKVETYLRMLDLDYETTYVADPRKSPKGKLPYIKDHGKDIPDSSLIAKYLEETYKVDLDTSLSDQEKAVSTAFSRMVEEHFYWTLVYCRWIDDNYWPATRDIWFSKLPPVMRNIIPVVARNQVRRNLHGQGVGRHTSGEIYRFASGDLKAIADFLHDKSFLMGDNPTSVDATIYAHLANVIEVPLDTPIKQSAMRHDNLVGYCERMKQRYYA